MANNANNDSPSTLLSELKRRKVVQFAIAYLVIAWVVVQVADVLLPAYGAPNWATQATITFLIVAFPPALILAWLFNITASGVELTEDTRWSVRLRVGWTRWLLSALTLVLTGMSVWWVWQGYLREQGDWIRLDDSNKTPVVAVAPVRNLSGNADLDWLGDGLASLVRNRLAQSRHLVTVSEPRWRSIVRDIADPSELLERAAEAQIDYIVTGVILSSPGGLILDARVTDTRVGDDVESYSDEGLTAESVLSAVYPISIMAKQALKIPHEEQVDSFAADFAVENFSAYRAYISGLQFILKFDYAQAEQSMRAALQLAPEFQIARYRLAMIYWVTGMRDRAAEEMQLIPEDAQLNRRERGYVEGANAFIRDNDAATAIVRYKQLLEEFPYEVEARQYLAEAYFHDYQENLAIAELRILGEQEPENQFVWSALGAYLTILGRHEEALPALQKYIELAPGEANAYNLMGDLYRDAGDFDQATTYFERALELDANFSLSLLGLAEIKAATGELAEAKRQLNIVVNVANVEPEDRITGAFDLAWILRAEGRFQDSSDAIEGLWSEIESEKIRESMALALRAVNAMSLENAEEAHRLVNLAVERSQRAPTRYLYARAMLQLAEARFDEVLATAQEIRSFALPSEDADRTEEKTATFIEGLVALNTGDPALAVSRIGEAISMNGYRYAIYERFLAEALKQSGDLQAARTIAAKATRERDAGSLRLDLERDRALAHQLAIQLALQSGDTEQADALISQHAERWGQTELTDVSPALDPGRSAQPD